MKLGYGSIITYGLVTLALMGSSIGHSAYMGPSTASFANLPWAPPSWHPNPEALIGLPNMDVDVPQDLHSIKGMRSQSIFVFDLDAGEILVARAADEPRPVASLTKLTTSLAMASEDPDLDREFCINKEFWPTRPGARSKFSTGDCYTGWDLMGAALVASDNRGAYGMQVLSDLSYYDFVARMDQVSEELGMTRSTWADPSGLEDDNLSTARDMARAAVAVASHPTLAMAATAPAWWIVRTDVDQTRWLPSTDRLTGRADVEVLAGKTGYTDTAGYCFAGVIQLKNGRRLALSVLGAPRSADRWADVDRIVREFSGADAG